MWWKRIVTGLSFAVIIVGVVVAVFYRQIQNRWFNNSSEHVVIVPGYGAPVAGNSSYEQYIQNVADYVVNPANKVDSVIFSGSYSNVSDMSEAEAMNSYFNTVINVENLQQRGIHVYQERCSIVSWQNVSYSSDVLRSHQLQPTIVTLFGDKQRETKLLAYAQYIFNSSITVPHNLSELIHYKRNSMIIDFQGFQFSSVTPSGVDDVKELTELVSAYDPKQSNRVLQARIEDWSNRFHYDVARNLVAKGCEQYRGFIR